MQRTPKEEGYRMPPEWDTHSGTQLHWPENVETWPGEWLQRVERLYLEIIGNLKKYEPVFLFVNSEERKQYVLKHLQSNGLDDINIYFQVEKTNDVWARDCGPVFVKRDGENPGFAITNWGYNAWGGKYPPFDDDDAIPGYFAQKFGIRKYDPGMILEGGSIETNGRGVMLTTESVLLNENRNPQLSKAQIEQNLKDYLGQEKIIWLKNGLAGDDTDGHIDDLSRFVNDETIFTAVSDDPDDVNYVALQENLEILRETTDQDGKPFKIETLPMPLTRIEGTTVDGSEFVPASYANFYIANGVVLVPLYDSRYDDQVIELFKHYFPERDVIGIACHDLVWGQGSIHCITQQLYGI